MRILFSMQARRFTAGAFVVALLLITSGCLLGPHVRRADRTSSVVDYLYPAEANPLAETRLPVLRLPLRVGVAFVPSGFTPPDRPYPGPGAVSPISEMQKNALLQRVAHAFEGRDYIASLQVIPSTYLRRQGGFENLDQIRRLLNIDVVALVSYDQVQFTDQNRLSLAYWTIVGAYLFNGNKNDTQTLMEASVYDIASRQLLFHAPGAGQVHANSTLIHVDEQLRSDSATSLQMAGDDLIVNLKTQLEDFRERMKSAPDTLAKIERKPGYTGAGDLGPWAAIGLIVLFGWKPRRRWA